MHTAERARQYGEMDAQQPSRTEVADWPVLVCLLGSFCVLQHGTRVMLRSGSKGEAVLRALALGREYGVARDRLLDTLWPDAESALAGPSLHSLIYSLHRLLGPAIGGASPVVYEDNCYRLNRAAGVGVDVACFDALVQAGDWYARAGNHGVAATIYERALRLYRGDPDVGTETSAIVEGERLRSRYLTLLARLAEYHLRERDHVRCLEYALHLLATDPCREDAHRLVMQCHMCRGERAQALRQYRLCQAILRREFDTEPEPATTALFDQLRRLD